jgi:hypothetical protein
MRVLRRELVAVLAVRLAGIASWCARSPQEVLLVCDRLKMRRIDARVIAAEVIEYESRGDRTDDLLIGIAVGPEQLSTADAKRAVTGVESSRRPNPTRAQIRTMDRHGTVLVNLGPEAIRHRDALRALDDKRVARGLPALVVLLAHTPCVVRRVTSRLALDN